MDTCQACEEGLYKKGTPVPALTETGAGAARYSAPHGCLRFYFSQPRPIATMGRGILLSGVRRQQQYHSQSDKRDHDQTSHGRAPFPACAAPSAGISEKRSNRAVRLISFSFSSRNVKSIKAITKHQPRRNADLLRDLSILPCSPFFSNINHASC